MNDQLNEVSQVFRLIPAINVDNSLKIPRLSGLVGCSDQLTVFVLVHFQGIMFLFVLPFAFLRNPYWYSPSMFQCFYSSYLLVFSEPRIGIVLQGFKFHGKNRTRH